MTPTRVETKLHIYQIMDPNTSKPWVLSWWSDKELRTTVLNILSHVTFKHKYSSRNGEMTERFFFLLQCSHWITIRI